MSYRMDRGVNHPVILLDDWDNELDFEPKFVGRHKDIESLRQALNCQFRLFGIFGIQAVGKSRLVKELLSQYVHYETGIVHRIIRLDLSNQRSTNAVFSNLYAFLGNIAEPIGRNDRTVMYQIVSYIRNNRNIQFIVFFDNVENAEEIKELHESLMSLIWQMANKCVNVKIFITSTTKFMSNRLVNIYFSHELLPLRPSESAELFKTIAPNIELGECEGPIVKLSEGLPLLISMIANELADDDGLVTPNDMVNMLVANRLKCLSRQDYYSEEDRIADIYKKFLERLRPNNLRRLALLGYIPGSFDLREAKDILGFKADHEVADQVLIPIRRRYMLSYDAHTRRFNIQGILRECLVVYFAIRNITGARTKFVKLFSSVMSELCLQLGTVEYVKALSQFTLEQPNFQKLLTEVYYTKEDTYQFFITIATSCTQLIEQFMLKECDKFYEGCLVMADRYGNEEDKAVVNIAVGSMWTNAKDDLRKGAGYYKEALKVLSLNGNRLQLAIVYQRLGWNLHKQGKTVKALGKVQYFQKSLNISKNGGPKFERLAQQSINSLGITNTVLGNFEEAERYHFTSLKKAKVTFGNNHPSVAVVLNNIGFLFELKGNTKRALTYYVEGLEIKMNSKAPASSLVMSISNVANGYSALNKYDNAHELLDKGFKIVESQDVPSQVLLAILYDTKGKVLTSQKRYREAVDMFEKAASIREVFAPEQVIYVESLVHLAIATKCIGHYDSSVKSAKKALTLKAKVNDSTPQNTFIAECYECLSDVYFKTGNNKKYSDTLTHLESELCRLEQVNICSCNGANVQRIRRQLREIREKRTVIETENRQH